MTRMASDIAAATERRSAAEVRLGEEKRTCQLGDSDGFSEHALSVRAVFPLSFSFLTYPEHLDD